MAAADAVRPNPSCAAERKMSHCPPSAQVWRSITVVSMKVSAAFWLDSEQVSSSARVTMVIWTRYVNQHHRTEPSEFNLKNLPYPQTLPHVPHTPSRPSSLPEWSRPPVFFIPIGLMVYFSLCFQNVLFCSRDAEVRKPLHWGTRAASSNRAAACWHINRDRLWPLVIGSHVLTLYTDNQVHHVVITQFEFTSVSVCLCCPGITYVVGTWLWLIMGTCLRYGENNKSPKCEDIF